MLNLNDATKEEEHRLRGELTDSEYDILQIIVDKGQTNYSVPSAKCVKERPQINVACNRIKS